MRSLVWFRRDLRVQDNSALFHAAKEASDGTVGVFLMTPGQWKEHDDADLKIWFWLENLRILSAELEKLNIPLVVANCESFKEVPRCLLRIAEKNGCDGLFFNREYEVNESLRDREVVRQFEKVGKVVSRFHDRIIVPPREISTKEGKFYSVFTPYRRVWDTRAGEFLKIWPKPKIQKDINVTASAIPDHIEGFDFTAVRSDLWTPGEQEAKRRLEKFSQHISHYGEARDLPSVAGTSLLSPYLVAGVISPRQCMQVALEANGGQISGAEGPTTWISELTWRDFYTHVMVGFPRVSKHQPFKPKTNGVPWRDDENDIEAWKQGKTGYPIVDAGMRQLNRTGWMHNRLRMVTAMFLTKNLLVDWRIGERYFMQNLVDGDLAANNGGWQWSASTGTDAVPYFRIFNPFSQSKRFDNEGKFIKKMCPELSDIPSKSLHDLKKLSAAIERFDADYPSLVVDYQLGRARALEAFKSLN